MATKSIKSVAGAKLSSGGQYVTKAAHVLSKSGLARSAVFKEIRTGPIYAYSVNPADPSKLIRESRDSSTRVGRLVNGKFRVAKAA